jgi:hypothetical protein
MPSYSTGQIGIYICNKQAKNVVENGVVEMDAKEKAVLQERFKALSGPTKHYHPRLQSSSFNLPYWVERYIYEDDDETAQGANGQRATDKEL